MNTTLTHSPDYHNLQAVVKYSSFKHTHTHTKFIRINKNPFEFKPNLSIKHQKNSNFIRIYTDPLSESTVMWEWWALTEMWESRRRLYLSQLKIEDLVSQSKKKKTKWTRKLVVLVLVGSVKPLCLLDWAFLGLTYSRTFNTALEYSYVIFIKCTNNPWCSIRNWLSIKNRVFIIGLVEVKGTVISFLNNFFCYK